MSAWWLRYGCTGNECGLEDDPSCAPPDYPWIWRRWASCPSTARVGACCAGCAAGKACEEKVGALSYNARAIQPHYRPGGGYLGIGSPEERRVGLLGIGEGYPWSVAEDLNTEIEKLRADVDKSGGPALQAQWAGFYPAWHAWYVERKNSVSSTLGIVGDHATELDAFVTQYNVLQAQVGVTATAKPFDTKSPLQKGAESGGESLGQGAGKALSTLGQGAVYLGVAVVAGAILYVAGPPLLARMLRR